MIIRGDAAHVVMHSRNDRDRIGADVDAGENARRFGNTGQPLVQYFRIKMVEVQIDVILELADAAPLANLDGHGAGNDVTRGEILGGRGIALHEALALGIDEVGALPARAFRDQAAGAVNAGGMELHEFHILQR